MYMQDNIWQFLLSRLLSVFHPLYSVAFVRYAGYWHKYLIAVYVRGVQIFAYFGLLITSNKIKTANINMLHTV
jgi:hypothetical protein